MTRPRRPSPQTAAVLNALADDPLTWRYGYDLGQHIGLRSGSLYPILMRLADRGLLDTRWEEVARAGSPPRHLYRLTTDGIAAAAAARPASATVLRPASPARLREV
jgi:DNA-binding PadR family transcriptional regulator